MLIHCWLIFRCCQGCRLYWSYEDGPSIVEGGEEGAHLLIWKPVWKLHCRGWSCEAEERKQLSTNCFLCGCFSCFDHLSFERKQLSTNCVKVVPLQGHRRTASATDDIGAWNIVVSDDEAFS
ncbi:hypothetical protein Rs2_21596 [Raphanus sativus]|nr:hypothetical protein Rs2_21596 [Raphanus sativus]